jgi:hypothetical protein
VRKLNRRGFNIAEVTSFSAIKLNSRGNSKEGKEKHKRRD